MEGRLALRLALSFSIKSTVVAVCTTFRVLPTRFAFCLCFNHLQEKLNDKNVKHPNLFVTGSLPASIANYDFIFLDNVNRLGLTAEDLRVLKAKHPTKSFIYIFQATKQGNFRGENSFQHDVDVVVEVPEKGRAVQFGRFNQGGEMEIFEAA